MELKIYNRGLYGSNSFVLIGQNREAVLIDAGADAEYYFLKEKQDGYTIKYVLLTHGHIDHILGVKKLQDRGVKIGISEKDSPFLYNSNNLAQKFRIEYEPIKADFIFNDSDQLNLCGLEFKVIETAGHTEGSVCFLLGDMLFSGDTLFLENIGRTDFATGSYKDIIDSIQNKIFPLDSNITVYAGHGESTTIGYEREHNPFAGGRK